MNYPQVLDYLLNQLPMFQRIGAAAYRNDLGNITALCDILGNPQKELKCIHVAGTNGKGSVSHIIASILQQNGYKVGLFVSPHYKDYRERIKINGKYITKPFVTKFVADNLAQFKKVDASFFEMTTAMAFAYFKEKKVDFAVIEVGMGGRLDSTNIITPLLSVITNISLDHTQFLGDTLAKIAREKAGIIKPGVPVVIGEMQKETKPVFVEVAQHNHSAITVADNQIFKKEYKSDLKGTYQLKNIKTALTAIKVLRHSGVALSDKGIKHGLKSVAANTAFIGRWMKMGEKPLVMFDSAHNEGGLKELVKNIQQTRYKQLHFVYGTAGDKDITKNLRLLPKNATYYFCNADLPRALPAAELQLQAGRFKLNGNAYNSVQAAYKAAIAQANQDDMILVAGSVFVVAKVL